MKMSICGKQKKILLTGGSGFIGQNILESFLAEKYLITVPTHSQLDLSNTNSVDNFFKDKSFDCVWHTAGKPGHRNSSDLSNLVYTNLRIFENLERNKSHFKKFINFGSGAIYNTDFDITNASEAQRFNKIGTKDHDFCKYVIAKQMEHLENFIDINIFGIFGKYEDWEIRFISNAICKAIFDMPITLRQNRAFSYLYVEDLMPVLELLTENDLKYNSYNIVPSQKTTLLALAELVKKISGKDLDIKVGKNGMGLDYTGDNSRLLTEFPDLKFTMLEKAVFELYNYYEENREKIDSKKLLVDK